MRNEASHRCWSDTCRTGGSRSCRHGSASRHGGRGVVSRRILALDQGTSSSRALVFDAHGRAIAAAQRPIRSRFPRTGWVEQSPVDIWQSQLDAARDAVAQVGVESIDGVAIANQRETSLIWDRDTLSPLGPAIVWQCRRTAATAAELNRRHGPEIRARTGLHPDAYFSGPKFAWLLEHEDDAARLARSDALACGTVDSWLLANLTGGAEHATDTTNASRTMLWNLSAGSWDDDLCTWQGVAQSALPEVRSSGDEYGLTEPSLLGKALPILAVAGDQQAALYGHGITAPGTLKCTYGTGAFLLTHAGDSVESALAPDGLLLTAAADGGFAYEGGVFTSGSVVQWLRDELHLATSAPALSGLAASTSSSSGVIMIPALSGLGSPHWDAGARGAIAGITRGTTAAHIARAALESVAFRVREIVEAMESAGSETIGELRVDGGMASSDVLMQIQANALQRPIVRPAMQETTALGVARLAFEVSGQRPDIEDDAHTFLPNDDLERMYTRWAAARRAVQSIPPE